ncbi:MAG TPA: 2-C-methyl-D-erythritol 2,4-cyclodiphosphate synthase [candidate division Zixibacteria bacterium]|nr:2-C-methyl-D-erythritol 2,4-cyclodiphosphate synthase [candidate division Zixibacteria bacterium]
MLRVGFGYDVHKLVKGRKLILGGVQIPHSKGLLGHSDADALLHSICDAILGALADGDIGKHFPDTDKKYKGISSLKLLLEIPKILKQKKANLVNIDTTIVAEKPKLASYTDKMRKNISKALKISSDKISVKTTTQNGLGFIGKGEGIASLAIVLLEKK